VLKRKQPGNIPIRPASRSGKPDYRPALAHGTGVHWQIIA
jgi:hypothetical protein